MAYLRANMKKPGEHALFALRKLKMRRGDSQVSQTFSVAAIISPTSLG